MASPYKYNRIDLATDAIRLVKLLKGHQPQPIRCEIFETYLHQIEGVPYEALSYVWGTRLSTNQIWLDRCEFGVTENLYEALTYLRRRDEDRVLWVDAICIDQTHNAERGHQVRQMRLVYRAAQRVIIWLGASNNEIDCLYEWMAALDQQMLAVAKPHTMTTWENQWSFVGWQLQEGSRVDGQGIRQALADLLRRDWFSRIWVLQEAALAKSAMIKCGQREINSRVFVIMPSLLNICCGEGEQARLDIMPGLLRVKSWWAEKSGQDLLTLLQKFGRSKASDTRDIIYALLGVSTDANTSELMRPDYDISVEQAIQRSVAYFLLQQGNLSRETPPQLLPNWSMPHFLDSLHDLDLEVFKSAADEAQDALLYDLIICQKAKNNAERLEQYMRWRSPHGPLITIAIKRANSHLLDLLLETPGADTQKTDSDDKTPIAVAVEHGNAVAAHLMMQYRQLAVASRGSPSDCYNTAILVACKEGAPALRQFLFDPPVQFLRSARQGAFNGQTLLLAAAKYGDLGTMEWILSHAKITMSAVNPDGDEKLSRAARGEWDGCYSFLVQSFKSRYSTAGLSPLEVQLVTGFSVIVSQFNFGIYSESRVHKATTADQFYFLRRNVNVKAQLEEGGWFDFQTPLGYAAQAGDTSTVSLLLEKWADINSRDCDERASTPLHNAARLGHLDTVKLLVESGADIELMTETADRSTALWCAVYNGHTDIVRYLLEAGARVGRPGGGRLENLPRSGMLLWAALYSGQQEAIKAVRALRGNRSGD